MTLSSNQSFYLDFLRAMAAMAVLVGHSAAVFLPESALTHMLLPDLGVFIFFLLSGFLITYSVLRKYDSHQYGFKPYFIDRFSRIYAAYIPALIFVAIVDYFILRQMVGQVPTGDLVGLDDRYTIVTWIGNFFMLQDFPLFQIFYVAGLMPESARIDTFGSAFPFWTISIEWWIYMIFGLVVLVYLRNKTLPRWWVLPFLGFIALEPFYHFVGGPDQCLTMLWVAGMFACILFLNPPRWLDFKDGRAKLWLVLLAAFFAGCMLVRIVAIKLDGGDSFLEFQFGLYLAVAVFALLFALPDTLRIPAFIRKLVWFVADYSYSLYLIHFTILLFMQASFPGRTNDPTLFWGGIVLSNVVAVVFWFLFERHYRTIGAWLKARFPESPLSK